MFDYILIYMEWIEFVLNAEINKLITTNVCVNNEYLFFRHETIVWIVSLSSCETGKQIYLAIFSFSNSNIFFLPTFIYKNSNHEDA